LRSQIGKHLCHRGLATGNAARETDLQHSLSSAAARVASRTP
jgi:hypothetical protein